MKAKLLPFLLVFVLLLCGCSSKTPINSETFVSVAEAHGFDVDQGETDDECILEAYGAVKSGIIVQYYVTEDSYSKVLFNGAKNLYDEENTVKIMSVNIDMGDYHYYSFTGDDKFYIMAAVDDTYVSCVAEKDKKEDAMAFFEAIGYK